MKLKHLNAETSSSVELRSGRSFKEVIPLYFRIYMVLEQELRSGHYPEGVPLPSEQELAKRFEVSRVTIRNTMALLEEADLVIRQRGRGTFASQLALKNAQTPSFSGLVENIREFEKNTVAKILEFDPTKISGWARTEAGEDFGDTALKIVRTRSAENIPFSYSVCYVPYPEASVLDENTLGSNTVLATLELGGVSVTRADQRLTAVTADHITGPPLNVEIGSPLILMRRVVFGTANRVIEMIQIYYRPDRFEYRVSLSREAGAGVSPRWVPTSE